MRVIKLSVCVSVYVHIKEDMNLNEDRKAPLREKDLSTKREMVVQYISATAKSVSVTFFSSCFRMLDWLKNRTEQHTELNNIEHTVITLI